LYRNTGPSTVAALVCSSGRPVLTGHQPARSRSTAGGPGPDHPDSAESLDSLAAVLRAQGDLAAARPLHERALGIREARLGADHPDTVRSREVLAAVITALDKQR
jgi:hypothetical protein